MKSAGSEGGGCKGQQHRPRSSRAVTEDSALCSYLGSLWRVIVDEPAGHFPINVYNLYVIKTSVFSCYIFYIYFS